MPQSMGRDVVLWERISGLRCTFGRRVSGPPFEVTIARGAEVVSRIAFEHDEDAANFAIAAMRKGEEAIDQRR